MATTTTNLTLFAEEVGRGLSASPKRLPCKYLYDDLGSALFEAITRLPEYGVTRAEEKLLRACAGEIADQLVPGVRVVELGSGGGLKTDAVLGALRRAQAEVVYHPIDISAAALEACRQRLGTHPGVRVEGIEAQYLDGLGELAARRQPWPPVLVLFLGSNIGNFDEADARDLLVRTRESLREGDMLLVGADLIKPAPLLLEAYDDPTGVTAAFNLNILGRINRELGGTFDLRRFTHEARWNSSCSRVEMHLRSDVDQEVRVDESDLVVRLRAGETIWTESSYKYDLPTLDRLARTAGFERVGRWTSGEWAFAECLWRVG
jgi:L-histidine Nalpha-methyltransferase